MLSKADNDYLCRIGPGTPMGNLFRQYWLPAMKSDELPGPDCPPLRLKLLGEELIAFRMTSGKVGIIQNACPHRGASLFFGRNEEEGLRCVYHGWKFDAAGSCVDMPSEPVESNFKSKVHATAYRTHERSGIIWAYLGGREVPPALPELEANMLPEGEYNITVLHRANNWMQGWEGEMDTLHAAFLHFGATKLEDTEPGSLQYYEVKNRSGRFSVRDTDVGVSYSMIRPAEEDTYYHRVGHMLFPCFAMVPPAPITAGPFFIAYVPMDDHHTLEWNVSGRRRRNQIQAGRGDVVQGRRTAVAEDGPPRPFTEPISDAAAGQRTILQRAQFGPDRDYLPHTTGWHGRYNITQNFENDFLIDREAQRNWVSYTGIRGIRQQDMAMTESMGPIMNRSNEHLGTTDALIIRTRRRLIASARALQEHGILPPGVESPEGYHQRSGGIILPRSADWWEATREIREQFNAPRPQAMEAAPAS
jgi:phenylpropionate dioxygenase-like ring-hydroxylating dioxygenase large terminal subunit